MDACKSTFNYRNECCCGIPQITLLGYEYRLRFSLMFLTFSTHEDWKLLRRKAIPICELLFILDWKRELNKVLETIERCTDGMPKE